MSTRIPALAVALTTALVACGGNPDGSGGGKLDTGSSGAIEDADGDGAADAEDCAPNDASVFPGADETCNGVDDNCNGTIDDNAVDAATWHFDSDGDGYAGADHSMDSCTALAGYLTTAEDCDDGDETIFPGAVEVPYDGIDQDCIDGDFCDLDGDLQDADICGGTDCDDGDPDAYLGAVEEGLLTRDMDCDGAVASIDVLDQADISLLGALAGDNAGTVASAGDVDGDGLDDILVGVPYGSSGGERSGQVHLLLGSTLASASSDSLSLADADFIFVGEEANDYAGKSMGSAGDVDGDGLDDIIIGAESHGTDYTGAAYVILGRTLANATSTTMDLANADLRLLGTHIMEHAGNSVASAGDIDGDGLDDIVVGAMMYDPYGGMYGPTQLGRAYVVLGSTVSSTSSTTLSLGNADFIIQGRGPFELAGASVSSAGDVDNDGKSDLLIGAPFNEWGDFTGSTYLFLGDTITASTGFLSTTQADYALLGEYSNDTTGWSSQTAGDVDGDGLDDILVSRSMNPSDGGADGRGYLLFGKTLAATTASSVILSSADVIFTGDYSRSAAGSTLNAAGDVDGDGLADILVGDYIDSESADSAGKTALFLGSSLAGLPARTQLSMTTADYSFLGETNGDLSGAAASSAGDINGDGLDDILVSAPSNGENGVAAGKAYVILSRL